MADFADKEFRVPQGRPESPHWVPSGQLTDLWKAPTDPSPDWSLERMGGEPIDPWGEEQISPDSDSE